MNEKRKPMKFELSNQLTDILIESLGCPEMFKELSDRFLLEAEHMEHGRTPPKMSDKTLSAFKAYATIGYMLVADFANCQKKHADLN